MFVVRIEHAVPDFDAWKKAIDRDPVGRQQSGVRRYRVLCPRDDTKYVTVELELETSAEADALHAKAAEAMGTCRGQSDQ